MTKSWSGVEVYRQPKVQRGVGDTRGSSRDTKNDVADTHCIAHRRGERGEGREVGTGLGTRAHVRSAKERQVPAALW